MTNLHHAESGRKHWLRLWHDMPTDPKFRVIARRSGRSLPEVLSVFVMMLTNASANVSERGSLDNWSDEDVAAALDMEPDHVAAIRDAMHGKLIDGERLTGWSHRQPKREDDSAERVRAHRERKKTNETTDETQCNADVTQANAQRRGEERREEKRESIGQSTVEFVAARDPDRPASDRDQNFSDCKQAFNGTTEAMLSEVMAAMHPYGDRKGAASWLATTMRINGANATAQAFQMLATAKAEGQPIARVLPLWAKTAASLKAKPPPDRDKPQQHWRDERNERARRICQMAMEASHG